MRRQEVDREWLARRLGGVVEPAYPHVTTRPDEGAPELKSVVFRLNLKNRDALRALARQTRISQSTLLREAIQDVLEKHGGAP